MKLFGDILRFLVQVFPLVMELVESEKERKRERKAREDKDIPSAEAEDISLAGSPTDSVSAHP